MSITNLSRLRPASKIIFDRETVNERLAIAVRKSPFGILGSDQAILSITPKVSWMWPLSDDGLRASEPPQGAVANSSNWRKHHAIDGIVHGVEREHKVKIKRDDVALFLTPLGEEGSPEVPAVASDSPSTPRPGEVRGDEVLFMANGRKGVAALLALSQRIEGYINKIESESTGATVLPIRER